MIRNKGAWQMAKRRRLNREIVVETAVTMANEAGSYEAVTLVALAKALKIRMPSLYNHIDSLDDLRQAMAVYGLTRLIYTMKEAAVGLVGEAALLVMADAYRQFAHNHPGIYPLTVSAPEADDPALAALGQELSQTLLLVLASFGLSGDSARHAMRGYRALLHGFTALEAAGGFRHPLSRAESFHNLLTTFLAGLAADRSDKFVNEYVKGSI
jgi:AcrR family transcriptional regulator